MRFLALILLALPGVTHPAFAGSAVQDARSTWESAAPTQPQADSERGSIDSYVRLALGNSPRIEARYHAWDAAVRSIRGSASLPDPTVGLSVFVQSIETRTGPQQARLSAQQGLPWPAELAGRKDAAVATARHAEARFTRAVLDVSTAVTRLVWDLWEVRASRQTHTDHLVVLNDLATTLRARVEVGAASLAAVQQLDLSRARLQNMIDGMVLQEHQAEAALRAALGGLEGPFPTKTSAVDLAAPTDASGTHPALAEARAAVDQAQAQAQQARARRAPGFFVGADWVAVGAAPTGGPDSGRNAFAVGGGLRVPLWQGAHAAKVQASKARVEQSTAEAAAVALSLEAATTIAEAEVQDQSRQLDVVRDTLLPQAETAYASILGSYAIGKAGIAQVLLAQRDLLELNVQLIETEAGLHRARADLAHARGHTIGGAP